MPPGSDRDLHVPAGGAHRLPRRQLVFYRWNLAAVRGASRIITVSDASRRELASHLRLPPASIDVVYNGVEAPEARAAAIPSRPYLLYVGSYEARKNLTTAVHAFARIAAVRGPAGLGRTVVALNVINPAGLAALRTDTTKNAFSALGVPVVTVPHDRHLAAGVPIVPSRVGEAALLEATRLAGAALLRAAPM